MLRNVRLSLLASLCLTVPTGLIAAPTVPLAAYEHPEIPGEATGVPIAVSPDGKALVYSLIADADPRFAQSGYFLPNGTPGVANGEHLHLLDIKTKADRPICAAKGNDWNPSWSPDGRHVAFYSDRSGAPRLWLLDVAAGTCRQLGDLQAKSLPFPGDAVRWSPDGATLFLPTWPASGPGSMAEATEEMTVGKAAKADKSGITLFTAGPAATATAADKAPAVLADDWTARCANTTYMAASLYAVRVADGTARLILDDALLSAREAGDARHRLAPYIRVSPSGRWLSYGTTLCRRMGDQFKAEVDLYVVPTAGGTPVRVAQGLRAPGGGSEFDYLQRWNPVRDEIAYIKDGKLWRVGFTDTGPAAPQQLGQSLAGLAPHMLRYTADGGLILVGVGDEKSVLGLSQLSASLYRVPSDGGAAIAIKADPAWGVRALPARSNDTAWTEGTTLFVKAVQKGSDAAGLLALDWAKGTTAVRWQGAARLDAVAPTAAGPVALHQDFAHAPDIALLSPPGKGTTRLTHVAPALDTLIPGTIERFETVIPNRNGGHQTVGSTIILPPGKARGDKLPAVVWFYPSRNMNTVANEYGAPAMGDLAHLLTARGYAVLLVDIPLGPDGEAADTVSEIVDVLLPQVYHAIDLGYVDPKRLALRGQSYGGYATAAIVTRTNLFAAAIPSSGKYDLGGAYAMGEIVRGTIGDNSRWSEVGQGRMGVPLWDNVQRYIDNSPYYHADQIHTPLLILEGTNDPVGYYDAIRLFTSLRRLNRPVELALYEGGGHSPAHWRPDHAVDQMARTLDFLDRYLQAPPASR